MREPWGRGGGDGSNFSNFRMEPHPTELTHPKVDMNQRLYAFASRPTLDLPVVYLERTPPSPGLWAEFFPGTLTVHCADDFGSALSFGRGNYFITAGVDPECLYRLPIPGPRRLSLVLRPDSVKSCDASMPLANLIVRYLAGDETDGDGTTDWTRALRSVANGLLGTSTHPRPELASLVRHTKHTLPVPDSAEETQRLLNVVLRLYLAGRFCHAVQFLGRGGLSASLRGLHGELMGMSVLADSPS